ncbi:FIST signal transduction protein [Azospira inquinata]|nr:FIST C-terminal domain-containing protein [Azospira inquinata]
MKLEYEVIGEGVKKMRDGVYLEQLSEASVLAALAAWGGGVAGDFHVLALVPEGERERVPLLQEACRQAGVVLAGGVFPQLLVDRELVGQGVVLLRIQGAPAPLLVEQVSRTEAVEPLAARLADYVESGLGEEEEGALFCIFDGLVPNISTHLDAWYLALADRVRYFGVNGGSESFTPMPCLFDGERCLADGVLLQLLPRHPGAFLEHCYGVPEQVITATSAQGNRIVQIDWQPALERYREIMARQYGVAIDRDNFYQHAVHFPFGILRADGEVLVRIPVGLDDKGAIVCVGEIPPYAVLTLLDARQCGDAAAALARDLAQEPGMAAEPLVLFYCAGRRMHLGSAAMAEEIGEVAQLTGHRRLLGALSLGEIGASARGGYPLFHNATLVGVPCLQP